MVSRRGIIVWISGFVTFLSILATFYMVVLLINQGATATVTPYIIGNIIGSLSIEAYLWISIIVTFIFFGITCIIIYLRQPPNPELVKLLLKIGGNLAALRKSQEASITQIVDQMEYGRKVNQKFFSTVSSDLQENKKETLDILEKQNKKFRKIRTDLVSEIETKINEIAEKLSIDLKKNEVVISSVKRLSEESALGLKNQQKELEEIKIKLEAIERNMGPNQATLKSVDNPEEIKGIGPALGSELRMLGINSVGEFLITDPEFIGEKTRISKEMAENLQASAQLMMIPGVDSNDAELLIEAGIKSQQELANHELIELSRKVVKIAQIYLDQGRITKDEYPTIEEISYWIRNSR
jgi:predicted flap endonuclease-1-like 5' DNA nuclease